MDALAPPDRAMLRDKLIKKLLGMLGTEIDEARESAARYRLGAVLLELMLEQERHAATMMYIPNSRLKRYVREILWPEITDHDDSPQERTFILLKLLEWNITSALISSNIETEPTY